jgi:ADP-ribosylglycohydrolase
MKGAIIGDVVGSVHEHSGTKTTDFPLLTASSRFTDDTVMTIAVADCLLNSRDPAKALRTWGRKHPRAGYGGMFYRWLMDDTIGDYGSWGNGGAMRVSPCGFLATSLEDALDKAYRVTAITHSHDDAIKGAQAVAAAIWFARTGLTKDAVRREIEDRFGYRLDRTVDEIRVGYAFDVSTAGTVPPALTAAFEADDLEGAIRLAVSLGGDADTLACIAGAIAEALYGAPDELWKLIEVRLPQSFKDIVEQMYSEG